MCCWSEVACSASTLPRRQSRTCQAATKLAAIATRIRTTRTASFCTSVMPASAMPSDTTPDDRLRHSVPCLTACVNEVVYILNLAGVGQRVQPVYGLVPGRRQRCVLRLQQRGQIPRPPADIALTRRLRAIAHTTDIDGIPHTHRVYRQFGGTRHQGAPARSRARGITQGYVRCTSDGKSFAFGLNHKYLC